MKTLHYLTVACLLFLFSFNALQAQWVQTDGPYGGNVNYFAISSDHHLSKINAWSLRTRPFSEISTQMVIVNLQAPPPYQMRIEDMWDLIIVNRGKESEVYLHGTVTELTSGLIVDVSTSVFKLPIGSKRIRAKDVGRITINEKNVNYQSVINRLSMLPNGSYEICIEVIDAKTNSILGVSCISHSVLSLSQITLIYPDDQATLFYNEYNELLDDDLYGFQMKEEKDMTKAKPKNDLSLDISDDVAHRIFSWLPPVPVPRDVSIEYKIKIVEVYDHQSPYDAMQSNPLFFTTSNIKTTSYIYPIAAKKFNSERSYAWQVEAYSDGSLLASSEIYTFSFKSGNQSNNTINDDTRGKLNIIRASNTITDNLPEGLRLSSSNNLNKNSLSFRSGNFPVTNNLFSIPNLAGSLLESSETRAVSFSFEGELSGETANRKGSGSDRKPSNGYLRLTPSVSFYGVPFGLNLLLSSENSAGRQNVNSVSFFYSVDAAKETLENQIEAKGEENVPGLMKFFSYFNSFGIGTNYPTYTPYTIQGVPVSGLSFEFNPGWFYLAAAFQQNQKPINNVTFRRDLYAGRIGIGKKDYSHLFFTGIYANDLAASIKLDSLNRFLTPNSNYVIGIDGRLSLFEDKLLIDGELSGALLTRDNQAPALINEEIPKFVRNVFKPNVSSQVDYAYSIKTTFNNSESNTKITAGVKMIGPGYKTLGNPTLRNDRFEVEGKVDQKFAQRQISVTASIKYYRDNLINSKLYTTTTLAPGIQLGLRFKNYPSLNLSYNPNFLSNDAIDPFKKIDLKNHLFTANTGYNFKISNGVNLASNLFYMFNKSESLDSLSGYTLNSFSLSENLSFRFPLVIGVGFDMSFMNFAGTSSTITNLDGNVGYTFFEQWNNIVGVNYSFEKEKNNRLGFYLNSTFDISEKISTDLRIEKNNYSDKILNTNDYNEILARTTIRIKF